MSAALALTCRNMLQSLTDTGKEIGKGIYYGYDSVGRKIEHVTARYFGDLASGAISSIYWSLPYTALLFHLPLKIAFYVSVVGIGGWGAIGHDVDTKIGREDRARIYRGIRNYCVIHATTTLFELYAKRQLSVAWDLAWWVLMLLQANTIARSDTPQPINAHPPGAP